MSLAVTGISPNISVATHYKGIYEYSSMKGLFGYKILVTQN